MSRAPTQADLEPAPQCGGARHYNRTLRTAAAKIRRVRHPRRHGTIAGFIAFLALAILGPAGMAADLPAGLVGGGTATVVEVIDGDTVGLADGREVRLVGLQAPKLPLGRRNFPTWPLAEEAKDALEILVLGERVTLGFGGRRMDRHGRVLAHLFLDDGTWIQQAVLSSGMARVYSFADNRAEVTKLLEAERAAREAGRGIWSLDWYAIRDAGTLAEDDVDGFQLVEGRVLDVARVGNRAYLNFGNDWKTDFTLTLDAEALRRFEADGVAIESFLDRRVRARGWVEFFNGPMIEITHPEQIEVIDE